MDYNRHYTLKEPRNPLVPVEKFLDLTSGTTRRGPALRADRRGELGTDQFNLETNLEACRDDGDGSMGWGIIAHHKANRSGSDLYRKIVWDDHQVDGMHDQLHGDGDVESTANTGGDGLEGEEWITSGGGRYVVKGHGSWGDTSASKCSSDRDSNGHISTTLRLLAGRSREPDEAGHAGVARVLGFNKQRGGILLSPKGVTGFKDWYLKRNYLAKATSKSEAAPKSKYIRKLVLSSWKHNGAGAATVRVFLS